jgi:hypothetical protein
MVHYSRFLRQSHMVLGRLSVCPLFPPRLYAVPPRSTAGHSLTMRIHTNMAHPGDDGYRPTYRFLPWYSCMLIRMRYVQQHLAQAVGLCIPCFRNCRSASATKGNHRCQRREQHEGGWTALLVTTAWTEQGATSGHPRSQQACRPYAFTHEGSVPSHSHDLCNTGRE